MRKAWLPFIAVAALVAAACQGLFTPNGCTQTVTVTDSLTTPGSPVKIDTIARFKLCAQ